MHVLIKTNIGTNDGWCPPFMDGETHKVDDAIGKRLIASGWAVEVADRPVEPEEPEKPSRPQAKKSNPEK